MIRKNAVVKFVSTRRLGFVMGLVLAVKAAFCAAAEPPEPAFVCACDMTDAALRANDCRMQMPGEILVRLTGAENLKWQVIDCRYYTGEGTEKLQME